MSEEHIEVEGHIQTVLPGTMFRVQLDNGHMVLAHISGKLRKHFIKIAAGDKVKMEMSPYDLDKARITYYCDGCQETGDSSGEVKHKADCANKNVIKVCSKSGAPPHGGEKK